ncbi:hypothetical protein [Mycobacterium sp.]|uniref:hypothetical protein n=1 Tax=Mycobacterium sp. TaxID=1785 RepID=UPI003D101E07
MPTPKPSPAHGALGELPPDGDTALEQAATAPEGEDYERDTPFTEDEAPASVSGSDADDNS